MIFSDTDIEEFVSSLFRDVKMLEEQQGSVGISAENIDYLIETRDALNNIISAIAFANKRAA